MTRPYAPGHRIPTDLLLKAYASGVFPMAESAADPEVFWVRPETRGIIPLDGFHVPKSLAKTIRQGRFDIRFDTDFEGVIDGCAETREDRRNTWINAPIREAYVELLPARPLPFGRSLARRPAGRRALRRVARPRLLRRKHVLARDATPRRSAWCIWSSG